MAGQVWEWISEKGQVMGELVSASVELIQTSWSSLMESGILEWINDIGGSLLKAMVDGLTAVIRFATGAVEFVSFFVKNWQTMTQLIWESIKLACSNAISVVMNWGNNVRQVLGWLGENFFNIFQTVGSFVSNVFMNVVHNIREAWSSLLAWIEGESFAPDYKPLMEGFKNTVTAMPELSKAAVQQSNEILDGLNKQLGDNWAAMQQKKITVASGGGSAAAAKAKNQAERDKWITGGTGRTATGGGSATAAGKFQFTSLSGLAEKMQQEAGQQDLAQQQLGAQQDAVGHLATIAGAVTGTLKIDGGEQPRW